MNKLNIDYDLLEDVLPKDFKYPKSFLDLIDVENIKDLPYPKPYYFLGEFSEHLRAKNKSIKKQYPKRVLVPFAEDEGSDDVFCFDGTDTSGNPKVYQVHTFASEGWEDRGYWDSFDDWYEDIKQISQEFKEEMEEDE